MREPRWSAPAEGEGEVEGRGEQACRALKRASGTSSPRAVDHVYTYAYVYVYMYIRSRVPA